MTDTVIECPNCHTPIPVSEVLQSQVRGEVARELKQAHVNELQEAVEKARRSTEDRLTIELRDLKEQVEEKSQKEQESQQRELDLRKANRELLEKQENLEEETRERITQELRSEAEATIKKALDEANSESQLKLEHMEEALKEQKQKLLQAQESELALRKAQEKVEARARELDLEVARQIDAEKIKIEQAIREQTDQEQSYKLKEKEKHIEDLRKALENAKRKSELGSQELQGEVLELDIQATLEHLYPHDSIEPVPKGVRGVDIIHVVRNALDQTCGTIAWETKNTKNWSPSWIEKVKDDQRAIGAEVAVIVSVALPEGIEYFGEVDGVWVASPRGWKALSAVLREMLAQVAFAHAASEGKHEKMEVLYRYLAGDQFRQKVQGIVEAFTALQEQVHKERRAMEKQWREREKQIERVVNSTVGMYGEMSGILGGTLPTIAALELDDGLIENESGSD